MKKMIGIVGEGPTDYMVIKEVIDHITGAKPLLVYWTRFFMKLRRSLTCLSFKWMRMFPEKKEKFIACVRL